MSRIKITTSDFVKRATTIHNNKYDYSATEYVKTHIKVKILCNDHGIFEQTPVAHLRGQGCPLCAIITKKETFLKNYGVDHPLKNDQIKSKIKQTNLNRYGHENVAHGVLAQQKIKATNKERYGGHPKTNQTVQYKYKQTCLNNYGVDNPSRSNIVKNKKIETCLANYQVMYPQLNNVVRSKSNNTMLMKYGQIHAQLNDDIKNQTTQTNLQKYGVKNYSQHHMVNILPLIEDPEWLFDQYIIKNKTATQIAIELGVDGTTICNYLRKHEIIIRQHYNYSYKSIKWLESIIEQEGINIQYALHMGEYQIPGTKFKADGYCLETNTIYEFHGDYWHGNPDVYAPDVINEVNEKSMGELYQKTIEREAEIRSMGYNLIVMWENNLNKE